MRARVQQQVHHRGVSVCRRHRQRRVSLVVRRLQLHAGRTQQQRHQRQVAVLGGEQQRRLVALRRSCPRSRASQLTPMRIIPWPTPRGAKMTRVPKLGM